MMICGQGLSCFAGGKVFRPLSWMTALVPAAQAGEKKGKSESSKSTASTASSGSSKSSSKTSERQREQAKQAAETQREAAKQAAEKQSESVKQAEEKQSESAKEAAETARETAKQAAEREAEGGSEDENRPGGGIGLEEEEDDEKGPPGTLAEVFRRLMKPAKPKSRGRADDYGGPGSNGPRGRNEILAVNLSPGAAAHARKLGFKVGGSTHISHAGGNVTRLIPPNGMDAGQARNLLRKAAPQDQFAVNQRYAHYQPARRDMTGDSESSVPARRGRSATCAEDQCFGPKIIHWQSGLQTCAKGLRVGVIDTAVDQNHPAFSKAKILLGGFLPEGVKEAPAWHGTGVLSLLAGDSDSGTPGLIPQAHFYIASVFLQDEKGEVATDTLSVLSALEWMSAFDVKVVNMSFSGPRDELVEKAIERMSQEGVVFVAAVGNDGPTSAPGYPASYRPVVAVTAVSKELRNYPYANRSDIVDVAAPGVDIWSAVPDGREGYHTGTSFAAPYATAILAALYPGGTKYQKKEELLDRLPVVDLGAPGRDPIYGRGLALAPSACGSASDLVAQGTAKVKPFQSSVQPSVPVPYRGEKVKPSTGSFSLR